MAIKYLRQWAVEFIRHMDAFERSIVEMRDVGEDILVTHKKKNQRIIVQPNLKPDDIDLKDKDLYISLFTLNTKGNLDALIRAWHTLIKHPRLKIFFVNPYSAADKKWVISPAIHAKISDDDSFKVGLNSLFQTVPPVSIEEVKRMEKEEF